MRAWVKTLKPTYSLLLERFSIECRKAKTGVITAANQKEGKCNMEPMGAQSKTK